MELKNLIAEEPEFTKWIDAVKPEGKYQLTGLMGSAKTLALAQIWRQKKHSLLVVEDDLFHAQRLAADLGNIVADEAIHVFPVEEMMAVELATSSPAYRRQRVETLQALTSSKPQIVITATSGLRRLLPAVDSWKKNQLQFKVGGEVDPQKLAEQLTEMGYQRQKLVGRQGEFAVRGSIIDIFPLDQEDPIRIDLFDTEIDSLRTFDVDKQSSIKNIESARVIPATDFIASQDQVKAAGDKLADQYHRTYRELKKVEDKDQLEKQLTPVIADLKAGHLKPEHLVFAAQILGIETSILDYLPQDGLVVFDDYNRLLETESELVASEKQWVTEKVGEHRFFANEVLSHDLRNLQRREKHAIIFMSLFAKGMGRISLTDMLEVKVRAVQQFFGQMPLLKTESDRWVKQKSTVVILIADPKRLAKISQTLDDFKIEAIITKEDNIQPGIVQIVNGNLAGGFELPKSKIVVLTENELFQKATKKRPKRMTMSNTERLRSYKELKKGDYVVHVNHGIGRYIGMKTMEVDGKHQDYITLEYQNNDRLFIPVTQLDRIQKYVASESKAPRINKLGGTEWSKTKRRVASKIEDIADDLIDLYSKRDTEKGHAFPKDDSYQQEFEDAFPYTETPDQLRSAKEIKEDMEKPKPMDRLLIGDVGYGKTEVALRAAFKAVEDGKQVALLAPTTVLAQQHYETILERFEDFPVEAGILSRFSTAKQVKETLADLKSGKLDIIVGTHRLLSKDVEFHDLGLLIIDEEQRFGVKHKERLKQLKSSVDVLTLTATPIPRTLNMSMLGVRDLSVIETAPSNRYPIQTYVIEQNYSVIVDAIRREMERGGQVFYLHNRVGDIEKVVAELKALVPEARIAYIHGQMTETQMERILFDFIGGEYDVLVTTTIIETGVDIPNVNTLFVENADRMGLAQLYQLRGRVGRSNRVAYAYFMYQPNKVLTEVSEKRLEAIKDFTELGSGFKIAMRDLSIRGAGNLLGKQQHGFIDSVGYDLYTQMLNDAVAKRRGKKTRQKSNAEIDLSVEAYLPADYISDQQQKIEIYKRISQFENEAQYREVQDDLIDRFGEYPQEVANLLEVGLLKVYADQALVDEIRQRKNRIVVTLSAAGTKLLSVKQVMHALASTKLHATMNAEDQQMKVNLVVQPRMTTSQVLEELQKFMQALVKELDADSTEGKKKPAAAAE